MLPRRRAGCARTLVRLDLVAVLGLGGGHGLVHVGRPGLKVRLGLAEAVAEPRKLRLVCVHLVVGGKCWEEGCWVSVEGEMVGDGKS